MIFKLVCITCLVLCISVSVRGYPPSNDYGFKNRSVISKGFKKYGRPLFDDGTDLGQNLLRDQIIDDLSASIEICQRGLDEAAKKVGFLLDLISPDEFDEGKENLKTSEEESSEKLEGDLNESPEIEVLVDDFSDISIIKKMGRSAKDNIHVNDLENLLQTFNHACSSLPTILPSITSRRVRSPQKIAQRLALSLKKWAEKWFGHVESKLETFLMNCLKNEECEHYLQKGFKLFIEILKEYNYDLDEDTKSILKELQHSPYKSIPSIETLNDMQRAVLAMGNPLDSFKEDDGLYHIADAVNGIEDQKKILEDGNGFNPLGLMSNLLRYRSFETIREAAIIEIDEKNLITKLPPTFLSLTFGSSIIEEGWGEVRSQKEKFKKIASTLSPSILRVGGSAANFLTYNQSHIKGETKKTNNIFQNKGFHHVKHPKNKTPASQGPKRKDHLFDNLIPRDVTHPKGGKRTQYMIETNKIKSLTEYEEEIGVNDICQSQLAFENVYKNFTMTGKDWMFLTDLIRDLKWELVFDLNQFWRDPQGNWDPTNAKLIINDPQTSTIPIIWQLGNEPNSYHHKFNWSITPEEAAEDYQMLADVVAKINTSKGRVIVGPDITRPKHLGELQEDSVEFLIKFLKEGNKNIDAVTWHQYYIDGRTATLEDFLSSEILNAFPLELHKMVAIRDLYAPGKPIWITETASAWGGGAPGLSNRFVGCFPWLDKLGAAALGGASHVFRQTLYGGCYSLLDDQLNPYPDFWVSVLHKHLVGEGVLLPRVRLANNSTRIYAHCLNPKHHMFQRGSIVIFGINLSGENERLTIMGKSLKKSAKFLYSLSAPKGDLKSRDILLNGNILKLSDDGSLPEFLAKEIRSEDLTMAPYTLNFWVFPDADMTACKNEEILRIE